MAIPNLLRRTLTILPALVCFAGLTAAPAAAQAAAAKSSKCKAYKVDTVRNRLYFNDPEVFVMLPEKSRLEDLRTQGTPGQIFRMKNCDVPDLTGLVEVYRRAGDTRSDPAEKISSAVRVVILGEKGDWVRVKGYTELWKGTGWIKVDDHILVARY